MINESSLSRWLVIFLSRSDLVALAWSIVFIFSFASIWFRASIPSFTVRFGSFSLAEDGPACGLCSESVELFLESALMRKRFVRLPQTP